MKPLDLTGMVDTVPVCPMCGFPVEINDDCTLAQAEGVVFLIHYECGDIEFFNA